MYYHTWAEVDLDALQYNVSQILKFVPENKVMGVVKANAYGHGAVVVAQQLNNAGIFNFAVSNAYEALELRRFNIKGDILILGNIDPAAVSELAKNNITVCLYDLDCAKRLSSAACNAKTTLKCNIKIDSGMGRLGFDCRSGSDFSCLFDEFEQVFSRDGLEITGAFTHFAAADRDGDEKAEFTNAQYRRFTKACGIIKEIAAGHGINNLCFHSANSAATLLDSKSNPSGLYRAGIILYGLKPSATLELPCKLKPVMSLWSTVSQIKTIKAGESISYGRTFIAKKDTKVATVSVGYADGYFRSFSGKGYFLINGKKAPVLGRVCMDQTIVDVSDIEDIHSGDKALIFGKGLSADILAKQAGTISYELLCAVAPRVPRVYIKNQKPVEALYTTPVQL